MLSAIWDNASVETKVSFSLFLSGLFEQDKNSTDAMLNRKHKMEIEIILLTMNRR